MMNTETMKEMAVKAKDKAAEFGSAHKQDILAFVAIFAINAIEVYCAYYAGCAQTAGIILGNEQQIRYAEAAANPNVEVHTNIPEVK